MHLRSPTSKKQEQFLRIRLRKLPAFRRESCHASLMTSSLAAKMASEKENVLVISRAENTNPKAKEAEKYLKDKDYIRR